MAADNRWPSAFGQALDGPGTGFVAIVQSDSAELTHVIRWIRFRASGTVKAVAVDGTIAEETVAAGEIWPVQIKQIWATGTSLADNEMLGIK